MGTKWRNEAKLSTSYFIFYRKMALWPVCYVVNIFVAKMLVVKMLTPKILDIHKRVLCPSFIHLSIFSSPLFQMT